MTLSPGARLGPYEILSAVGAGGMGEVYRARDTRLDPTVAIKILPEPTASDPDLRARFANVKPAPPPTGIAGQPDRGLMRTTSLALMALLVFGAAPAFSQIATVLIRNGDHVRAEVLSMGLDFLLCLDDRDALLSTRMCGVWKVPVTDVVLIDFHRQWVEHLSGRTVARECRGPRRLCGAEKRRQLPRAARGRA
jgi:hypothetical protein